VPADRKDGYIRTVDPPDQLHVAEDASVARDIDRRPVLERDHVARGFADVGAVLAARGVLGIRHREPGPVGVDRAAFVHGTGHVFLDPLSGQPAAELDHRDHTGRELLRELDGLAHMVVVAVRECDHVNTFRLVLPVGALRVAEPRVDVDSLAARCVEAKARVAEPGHGHVRHPSSLVAETG
jgi:hypothetical protein